MLVNDDTDGEPGLKKEIPKPPLKQSSVVGTIMILSFLSEANVSGKYIRQIDIPVATVLFCLLVILTEYKGRKLLFMILSTLSILSSSEFLTVELPEMGAVLQMAIRGATAALTGVILCEYVEPRHRLTYLMVNSSILRISSWLLPYYARRHSDFDTYLQFVRIALGLICLGSVLTWPESPYWLASKRRFEEAKKAFVVIRSRDQKSTELETLIEAQNQSRSVKMIYVPLLIGLPIMLVYTEITYDFEYDFYLHSKNVNLNQTWTYLAFNAVVTGASVLIACKLSRIVLILLPTATSTVCVIAIIMWEDFLKYSVSRSVEIIITDLSFLLIYHITLCAMTLFNYPIAIESISCKYSNLLSGIYGIIYFVRLLCVPQFLGMKIVLALIILCLLVNPIIAYFLLPETKGKSLIEIEQAYRPKVRRDLTVV